MVADHGRGVNPNRWLFLTLAAMVLRTAQNGKIAGAQFWGCSADLAAVATPKTLANVYFDKARVKVARGSAKGWFGNPL